MGVGGHGGLDFEGEGEGVAALAGGDVRVAAGTDGLEERLDLQAQRLSGSDRRLEERESGIGAGVRTGGAGGRQLSHDCRVDTAAGDGRGNLGRDAGIETNHEQVLARVIDRNIRSGLEEAQLAHALGGDAGCGEVGHAAGFEFDANVGDVDFRREDGEANGADFADGGIGHGENDVEVVNHEVKDDIDVERPRRKDGEPVGLEEHGASELRLNGQNGRVEALEMAGLKDALALFGECNQFICLGRSGGEWFFDEEIEAGIEQHRGNGIMLQGGDRNCGCIEVEIGGEQFFDGGEDGYGVFAFGFGGTSRIGLNRSDQCDPVAAGFEIAIDAKMIPAESAGSDYGNTTNAIAVDCYAPLPSTARRQRV